MTGSVPWWLLGVIRVVVWLVACRSVDSIAVKAPLVSAFGLVVCASGGRVGRGGLGRFRGRSSPLAGCGLGPKRRLLGPRRRRRDRCGGLGRQGRRLGVVGASGAIASGGSVWFA